MTMATIQILVSILVSIIVAVNSSSIYSSSKNIQVISSSSELDDLLASASPSESVLVQLYSESDKKSRSFKSSFEKIAKSLEPLPIKVVVVDGDGKEDVFAKHSVKMSNVPVVKFFTGPKRSVTYSESLGKRSTDEDAVSVIEWIFEESKKLVIESVGLKYKAPKKEGRESEKSRGSSAQGVIELTESSFKSKVIDVSPDTVVLVEFFAPWCGHCKQLAPTYAQVARNVHSNPETFGERTFIASVDATVHQSLAQEYGIRGFPTIKLFVGGKLKSDYEGARDAASITDFVKANIPPKRIDSVIKQLVDFNSDFKSECMKAPLCLLSFLPSLYDCDAHCRNGYLDILKSEATGEDGTGFGRGWLFLWTEGGFSEEMIKLEEDLGVGPGVGYPNLVVVNGKREKYAPFRGSFSKAGLKEFLKGIVYTGKGSTPLYPLPSTDRLMKAVNEGKLGPLDPWDGKDAPPLEVKEEL